MEKSGGSSENPKENDGGTDKETQENNNESSIKIKNDVKIVKDDSLNHAGDENNIRENININNIENKWNLWENNIDNIDGKSRNNNIWKDIGVVGKHSGENNECGNDEIRVSLDIGGTLTKVGILFNVKNRELFSHLSSLSLKTSEFVRDSSNMLHLSFFQTFKFSEELLPFLSEIQKKFSLSKIEGTGGGAHKFSELIREKLGIGIEKHDELFSLVRGYTYMNRFRSFYEVGKGGVVREEEGDFTFPHISVNIGSGVSILKVHSPTKFERIGGSLLGGATLIGLSKLIIGVDNYNDIFNLARKGNYKNLDLLIKDIYKGESENLKLPENAVASSLGKVHEFIQSNKVGDIKKEDIALSLVTMICFQLTQIAVIFARRNNIKKIYYFGNFTRRGSRASIALTQSSKFWDKEIEVRFNYFEGFLGAVGALLDKINDKSEKTKD